MTKILVLGHGEHGKGTAVKIIEGMCGLKGMSSSEAAFPYIWPSISEAKGYSSPEIARANKIKDRDLWKNLISLYNSPDKTTLARLILSKADIYDGMRDLEEFTVCVEARLFDYILWIDATERRAMDSSMGIQFDGRCMVKIDNGTNDNGERMAGQLLSFLRQIGAPMRPSAMLTAQPKQPCVIPSCPPCPPFPKLADLISKWADEVHPNRTITNAIHKMVLEEIPEYLLAQGDAMELADIGILLYDIAHLAGIDLESAIRSKMAINKERTWKIDETTGLMKHTGKQP